MPAWVEHGVSEVNISDSDYYDGYGRYAITHFLDVKNQTNNCHNPCTGGIFML